MRFSITSFFFTILAIFSTLALAAPISEKRDVFVPPVLEPAAGAIWQKGSTETVVWDVSNPPAQITNQIGTIYLRSVELGIILLDQPLAENFDILIGQKEVTVPTDLPAGEYQAVVFGDSGNWGPVFNIVD
ncbi:hypothetical protein EST38_g5138 [Candolleomyces aberdarensis]|uniref:DUF3244 domain-containing protein n=1 Tax=Candolleomyces aberdarensis TaxID=2316362 RepID=A0A4Q2DKT7_9AGAR|nr:hypothetical protein EST38_g5138 [Candolleomyces aberdarensis]